MAKQIESKEPAKMGRPPKPFDEGIFEGLCHIQCTLSEIAGVMGLSEDTIERRCKDIYEATFAEVFSQKRAGGLISLRRAQFRLAETNATMGIWLGKQYLEQKDKIEIDVNKLDSDIERELAVIASRSEGTATGEAEGETVH